MQAADEAGSGYPRDGAEGRIKRQERQRAGVGSQRLQLRDEERGLQAKKPTPHKGRRTRRYRHRQKRADAHLRQHQLDGEHHSANRRIECCGNAGPRASGDQGDPLAWRHADDLT